MKLIEIRGLEDVMPMLPLTFPSLQLLCALLRLQAIAGAFQGFSMSANRLRTVSIAELHAIRR